MASLIGYYRYKLDNVGEGVTKTIQFKNGANVLATKTIKGQSFCTGQKLLKFLCKDGQYRFYPFNSYFETRDNPQLIGKTNELITSILSAQTNSKNIGYKNERTMDLVSDELNESQLLIFSDIYTSPRVYLHIGSTGDALQDWLEVEIVNSDNIVQRRKMKFGTIAVTIKLPENFTVKMV